MKTVYICGDSFAVSDPEYGVCWADILAEKFTVINLSEVCASNLLISQQVDQAIAESADFIICLGTSSTRQNVKYESNVVPYSIHNIHGINGKTKFNADQQDILKKYITEFFDLDTAIYESKCIIQNTIQKLIDSGIPFVFDQGGFEHPSYGNSTNHHLDKYQEYLSEINLWSYAGTRSFRPYYHITDPDVHQTVADYYSEKILKCT